MKKHFSGFVYLFAAAAFFACNNEGDINRATATDTSDSSGSAISNEAGESNNISSTDAAAGTTGNGTRLNAADSTFLMKAAAGGLMEVQAGQTAQQNGQSERVKSFGGMMVNDHSKANQELMSLASNKGLTPPSTLPPDKQRHVEEMKKMQGKAFDRHYMDMMVKDHKNDVAEFEKAAGNATDPDVKAFAAKTLPVLRMHRDSATAIHSALR